MANKKKTIKIGGGLGTIIAAIGGIIAVAIGANELSKGKGYKGSTGGTTVSGGPSKPSGCGCSG